MIEEFAAHSMSTGRAMREMLEADPEAFFADALPVLRGPLETPGSQYLLTLLLTHDLIMDRLADPALFSLEEAVAVATRLLKLEPLLDIKMIRTLNDPRDIETEQGLERKAISARGIRTLEILAVASNGARILPVMTQLLRHPDPRVRSKAALLVGRSKKNSKWVEQRLGEDDARVRANAVESLWGVDSEASRPVFWGALADTDNRVVGNALLGLYRLGEAASIGLIMDLLQSEMHDFRTTAVWVIGETGDQRFLSPLAKLLSDPQSTIRTTVFRSIAKLKQSAGKYQAAPGIGVQVWGLGGHSQDRSRLLATVSLKNEAGEKVQELSGLKPTQFVLMENGELVTDYEVQEVSRPESLSVAFAVPRVTESNDIFHQNAEAAFAKALPHKRKGDAWLVLKYLPAAPKPLPPAAPGDGQTKSKPNAPPECEEFPLPPEARYLADSAAIMTAVEAAGTRMSLPPSLNQAALALLPAAAQSRGSRHVVLLQHPVIGDAGAAGWQEALRAARTGKVTVHAIGLELSPGIRDLCAKTGGIYALMQSEGELPRTLEGICASLVNHYRIGLSSSFEPGCRAEIRVQVYCDHGQGQDSLVFESREVPAAIVA